MNTMTDAEIAEVVDRCYGMMVDFLVIGHGHEFAAFIEKLAHAVEHGFGPREAQAIAATMSHMCAMHAQSHVDRDHMMTPSKMTVELIEWLREP